MKSRLLFFTIFLLILSHATSQVTARIISGVDGANLSYASITNLTQHTTYSANEFGEIELRARTGDSLKVTHIGYLPGFYIYSNNIEKTITLDPDNSILPPVIISNCRKYKDIVLKNQPKKRLSKSDLDPSVPHFAGYGWSFAQETYQVGFLLKTSHKNARLKKFSFWLKNFGAPYSAVLAPMQISLYSVTDTGDLPSKHLYREPIVYFPKEEGKQTINFDTMQITIPESGAYIMFEYIMDEKYAWRLNSKPVFNSKFSDSTVAYGASLQGFSNPGYTVACYSSKKDQWVKRPVNESICFEASLSYCKESQ